MSMKMTQMSMVIPKLRPLTHLPTLPLLHLPPGGLDMDLLLRHHCEPEKVVVVMGATGTGKSRLSIDLATDVATRFGGAEIINSDKMQVYKGLDIVTNKVTEEERRGVPHHLLGFADPNSDFSATNFSNLATEAANDIVSRGKLPIIVGGSNSFVEALVDGEDSKFRQRFQFCFLWVDASMPVLDSFVSGRIDRMVERGMIEEVAEMFSPMRTDYSTGIRRSIGVPELDQYFRSRPFCDGRAQARILDEALRQTAQNTRKLARRQRDKILRLIDKGWKIECLDATEVLRKQGNGEAKEADREWENVVAGRGASIVSKFLSSEYSGAAAAVRGGRRIGGVREAVAAAIY